MRSSSRWCSRGQDISSAAAVAQQLQQPSWKRLSTGCGAPLEDRSGVGEDRGEFLFVKHTVQTEWPVAMVAMLFLRSCCPTVRASKETPLGLQPDASLQGCCIRSLDILIFASALLLWPADASCTVPVLARDVGPRSFLGCSRSEIQQLQQQWHSRCSTQPSSL